MSHPAKALKRHRACPVCAVERAIKALKKRPAFETYAVLYLAMERLTRVAVEKRLRVCEHHYSPGALKTAVNEVKLFSAKVHFKYSLRFEKGWNR